MNEKAGRLSHDDVRILIVSSDVMTRGSALGALVAAGYTGLQTADSCEVAFQQVASATAAGGPFDMVIMDMSSRGDVYPTLRRLRNAFEQEIMRRIPDAEFMIDPVWCVKLVHPRSFGGHWSGSAMPL